MSSFVDIYINERNKKVPYCCEICGQTLQSLEDSISAYNEGACRDCFISFLEPNRSINGKDWVPKEAEIKSWLEKKRITYKPRYKFF